MINSATSSPAYTESARSMLPQLLSSACMLGGAGLLGIQFFMPEWLSYTGGEHFTLAIALLCGGAFLNFIAKTVSRYKSDFPGALPVSPLPHAQPASVPAAPVDADEVPEERDDDEDLDDDDEPQDYNDGKDRNDTALLLQEKEWKSGVITSNTVSSLVLLWVISLIFALVCIPLFLQLFVQEGREHPVVFVFAIFPIVGLGFLLAAIRATMQYFKFGKSYLDLGGKVGRIGGVFEGTVRCSKRIEPQANFKARLVCSEVIKRGSGKDSTTETKTLWQNEKEINHAGVDLTGGLSVAFEIPKNCVESKDSNRSGKVSWKLSLSAPLSGVDYEAEFEVPIYKKHG